MGLRFQTLQACYITMRWLEQLERTGEKIDAQGVLVGNLKEDCLEDLSVGGRIILK